MAQALTCAILTRWKAWIKRLRSTGYHKAVPALGCSWAPEFQGELQRAHSAEEAIDAPHHLVYPYLPAGLLENEWWVCRGGGALQWHCQLRLGDKGWWGQLACCCGHSLGHSSHWYRWSSCLQGHSICVCTWGRAATANSKPLRIPEISTQGKMGLQIVRHWCFRWVMGKRPVFIQCEANCLQILRFIFTGHSQTVPRITYQKAYLWKVAGVSLVDSTIQEATVLQDRKFLFWIE